LALAFLPLSLFTFLSLSALPGLPSDFLSRGNALIFKPRSFLLETFLFLLAAFLVLSAFALALLLSEPLASVLP